MEVSGAITGGSKVNKDLAYRFGTNNDIDEAQPIKQRLFVIEEALRKSANDILNKTNNLNKLNFNQRDILEDCVSSNNCLLYTSPSPRDRTRSRMPSSA